MPPNFLTLHRDDERHRYFSTAARRGPVFDDASDAWIVTDPSDCRKILGSKSLRPAAYAESYDALTARLGIGFPHIRFALDHIPLCMHGESHAEARLRSSKFLASRRPVLMAAIPRLVETHFARLRTAGPVELMHDAIIPLVHDLIAEIVDVDLGSRSEFGNASLLFDRSIGVGKRRRIDAEIGELRGLIASRLGDEATDADVGLLLAFVIVGKDPLVGTLGESLHRLLRENPSGRLSEIDYPALPPDTGVPIIERDVVSGFALSGCTFAKGDRVRCYLQSFGYGDNGATRKNFFGTGAHACLGGPLAIEVWRSVTKLLSRVPLRASALSHVARSSDYIFACPERVAVELSL